MDEAAFFEHIERVLYPASHRTREGSQDTAELGQLSLEEVELRLADPLASKDALLAILRARFETPTGSLTRLPKSQLVTRIETLIMNERGHASIARMAQGTHELVKPDTGGAHQESVRSEARESGS